MSLSLIRLTDLVILNASVTAKVAVPSYTSLPKPPLVILFVCVTKHDCLRKAGRSTNTNKETDFSRIHFGFSTYAYLPNC